MVKGKGKTCKHNWHFVGIEETPLSNNKFGLFACSECGLYKKVQLKEE